MGYSRSEIRRYTTADFPVDEWVSLDLGGALETTLRVAGSSGSELHIANDRGGRDYFTVAVDASNSATAGFYLTLHSNDTRLYMRRPSGSVITAVEVWMVKA